MKEIKDGWHKVGRYEVYTENRKVIRATKPSDSGIGKVTAYPYKASKEGGWDIATGVLYETLVGGMRAGRYAIK